MFRTAHALLSPDEISQYQLDVRYCGVCGINSSTHTEPNNFLHAFLHCEDIWITSSTDSSTTWLTDGKEGRPYYSFHRIGYARSASGGTYTDAYDLDKVTPNDASDTPSVSPTWVKGGWGGAVLTSPYSEGESFAYKDPSLHTGGVGAPQVVFEAEESYYYMFYTQQWLHNLPSNTYLQGGIAVARAPAAFLNVDSTGDYENYDRNDVWVKYTDTGWDGAAIGAATPRIVVPGAQARVSKNNEIDEWIMVYQKPGEGIAMKVSNGGDDWYDDWGEPIGITYGPEHGYYYPTLIGEMPDETDKETSEDNRFYFSHTPDGIPGHHVLKRRMLRIYE